MKSAGALKNAPREMQMPRESIQHLLKATYFLLAVQEGLAETQDPFFIRSAVRELQRGIGPLGLGVDYWVKIAEWRDRDIKEDGGTDFSRCERLALAIRVFRLDEHAVFLFGECD